MRMTNFLVIYVGRPYGVVVCAPWVWSSGWARVQMSNKTWIFLLEITPDLILVCSDTYYPAMFITIPFFFSYFLVSINLFPNDCSEILWIRSWYCNRDCVLHRQLLVPMLLRKILSSQGNIYFISYCALLFYLRQSIFWWNWFSVSNILKNSTRINECSLRNVQFFVRRGRRVYHPRAYVQLSSGKVSPQSSIQYPRGPSSPGNRNKSLRSVGGRNMQW